jgi:hypothetical protein
LTRRGGPQSPRPGCPTPSRSRPSTPSLALDTPLAGFPAELPAHLADELAELLKDAERYAAAAQDVAAGAPGSENNPAARQAA